MTGKLSVFRKRLSFWLASAIFAIGEKRGHVKETPKEIYLMFNLFWGFIVFNLSLLLSVVRGGCANG